MDKTDDDALYRLSVGLRVQIVLTFDDIFICVSETAANIYRDNTTVVFILLSVVDPTAVQQPGLLR